jgi:hypothetical protein
MPVWRRHRRIGGSPIFLRTQLIRGAIDGAGYEAAVRVLLRAIEAEPRLAPLLPRIDRERLIPYASAE